jgi:hypothetical protein
MYKDTSFLWIVLANSRAIFSTFLQVQRLLESGATSDQIKKQVQIRSRVAVSGGEQGHP